MSASLAPKVLVFYADAAIAKGQAVKIGTDSKHVAKAAAATDKCIGIAQNAATAAEDPVEVALPGGGGKALAQTTIAAGKLCVPHTDASIKPIASANDRVICMAMEDAVVGDLFQCLVLVAQGTATES